MEMWVLATCNPYKLGRDIKLLYLSTGLPIWEEFFATGSVGPVGRIICGDTVQIDGRMNDFCTHDAF